jgi:hypothetical protein
MGGSRGTNADALEQLAPPQEKVRGPPATAARFARSPLHHRAEACPGTFRDACAWKESTAREPSAGW